MRKFIYIGVALLLFSCQKLDSFMFANIAIDEYQLDDNEHEDNLALDSSYTIHEDKITLFTLESGDKKELIYAIYVGDISRISTDTVIMYCHGNYGHMDYYWTHQKLLANIGSKNRYGVLSIDYKGFGMSEGTSTEEGLIEDVNTALKWLKDNGLTDNRLVIYGFSLGTYPATYLTSKKEGHLIPSKLILEAPFASTKVMVNDGSKLSISNNFFMESDYENADLIKEVDQPFLWIHGKEDAFLSIETHGEVVYKNYQGNYSEAVRVEGAEHSTVPQKYGFDKYIQTMLEFITR